MRPFFQVASLLVFYIGFKFVGTGIHSLQVAQTLPAHSENWLLSVDFFGIYPTWETSLAQVALLGMVGALLVFSKRQERKSKQVQSETQPVVVATAEVVQQLDATTAPATPSQPIKA
jgi:high-affinity iron transporter